MAPAPGDRDLSFGALSAGPSVHATAILLGAAGVLIRGASGTGKSALALALIERWHREGRHVALICDDRVHLHAAAGRLIAAAAPAIAGLLEIRGHGIVGVPFERAAVIRLVVDLVAEPGPRLPEPDDLTAQLGGVELPRLVLATGDERKVDLVTLLLLNGISAMT